MGYISIVSLNVLNHNAKNISILLKKSKLSKRHKLELIKTILNNYDIVKKRLVSIIKDLINNNTIVFLQEVNRHVLQILKQNFNAQLYHTKQADYTANGINIEHRVIILPKSFTDSKITSHEIVLQNDSIRKNALMLIINHNTVLINVHLNWRLTYRNIESIAEKIYGEINKKIVNINTTKIVIAGDFNKSIGIVKKHFIDYIDRTFGLKLINSYDKMSNLESIYTSYTTDVNESKETDIIDHFLVSSNVKIKEPNIIDTYNNHNIFANIENFMKMITNNIGPEYISDHKMIKLDMSL